MLWWVAFGVDLTTRKFLSRVAQRLEAWLDYSIRILHEPNLSDWTVKEVSQKLNVRNVSHPRAIFVFVPRPPPSLHYLRLLRQNLSGASPLLVMEPVCVQYKADEPGFLTQVPELSSPERSSLKRMKIQSEYTPWTYVNLNLQTFRRQNPVDVSLPNLLWAIQNLPPAAATS